jgi:hypothetical protein
MFFVTQAMRFTRVNDQLRFDAIMLESAIQSYRLADRISVVILSMDDERRRFGIANKGGGRITREDFRMIPRRAEIPFVSSRTIFGFELCSLVKDDPANYRGLETVGFELSPMWTFPLHMTSRRCRCDPDSFHPALEQYRLQS